MIVRAPGKLVVTGAYAVLEGAPAIVCAIDRYAYARTDAREIDTRELYEGNTKLGLGSSAASLVARLGAEACQRGEDLRDERVRDAIFRAARGEHARTQSGGSGVDVAASTYGGVLRYVLGPPSPAHRSLAMPPGIVLEAFWSGTPALTRDLLASVQALRARDEGAWGARMEDLKKAAHAGADAVEAGDGPGFLDAARRTLRALDALGQAADAPIVPAAFRELAHVVEEGGGAFLPSGAGGGDVGVFLGPSLPPPGVLRRAFELDLRPLGVHLDLTGLRIAPPART